MSYDEGLAVRLREQMAAVPEVAEKKMFGGLCFMVSGNMCCGIIGDSLMARVGPDQYDACLRIPHVREMDFTGTPFRGMVYVGPEGTAEDGDLKDWVGRCLNFTKSLPDK